MIIRKLKKIITHRAFLAVVSFFIQLVLVAFLTVALSQRFIVVYMAFELISLLVALALSARTDKNPRYLLTWVVVILALPTFGLVLYFLTGDKKVSKAMENKSRLDKKMLAAYLKQDEGMRQNFLDQFSNWQKLPHYLSHHLHFPVYNHTQSSYYSTGEGGFEAIKKALLTAKKYIYLEYFIIKEGQMYQDLVNILADRAKHGVEVRLIYDDWGAPGFDEKTVSTLREKGIWAVPFNPLTMKFVVTMNNRTHRKIIIIDGQVAFISGMNIGDEYINRISRFGYWKDNAIRLEGPAILTLLEMFLVTWSTCIKAPLESLDHYKKDICYHDHDGYVQPFYDNPTDSDNVIETIHSLLINMAQSSIMIVTPYLVIGHNMLTALRNAARSGIDVRLVLPGIPDKKLVYSMSRSNYQTLLESGVKIYEYTPGFIHQKTMVVDQEIAVVSTANIDYRSYYLNYECGVILYGSKSVDECVDDFRQIVLESRTVDLSQVQETPWWKRGFRDFVNLFSGLM